MAGAYDELRDVLVSPLCPTLLQHSLQGGRELGGPQVDQDREAPGPSVRPLPCPARDLYVQFPLLELLDHYMSLLDYFKVM